MITSVLGRCDNRVRVTTLLRLGSLVVLFWQIVKTRHRTHRSENRLGNVEKSAFGSCPLAPRWSVTTTLVRLRRIFPLVIAVRATLPLRCSPRGVVCRAI